MGANSLMAVKQPGSFTRGGTLQLARQAPASPMLLQQFMQLLANLNQKVDALAVRTAQVPQVMPNQIIPVKAKPIESTVVEVRPVESSPSHSRQTKVNRSSLLDMFD
jgi:hypothetical protein